MRNRPLVLVSPSVEVKGTEFEDMSLSLSQRYERALLGVELLPWPVLSLSSRAEIVACVRRADGVLLTGASLNAFSAPRLRAWVSPFGKSGRCITQSSAAASM